MTSAYTQLCWGKSYPEAKAQKLVFSVCALD